jgi:hypothetical protein
VASTGVSASPNFIYTLVVDVQQFRADVSTIISSVLVEEIAGGYFTAVEGTFTALLLIKMI